MKLVKVLVYALLTLIVAFLAAAQMGMLSGAVGRRVHHIGAPKDEVFFTDFADDLAAYAKTQPPITQVALKDAEGIVCTGLADDLKETPQDYRAALLLDHHRHVAYGGARGGGKSWAVRTKAKLLALHFAGIKVLIVRRAMPELRNNHIEPLKKELAGIAKYNTIKNNILIIIIFKV